MEGLGGFGVWVGLEQKLVSPWTHMGGLGWVALGCGGEGGWRVGLEQKLTLLRNGGGWASG